MFWRNGNRGEEMRETKAFCDICKKQIDITRIYYIVGVSCDTGFITKPFPNNVETCSVNCAVKWLNDLLITTS